MMTNFCLFLKLGAGLPEFNSRKFHLHYIDVYCKASWNNIVMMFEKMLTLALL